MEIGGHLDFNKEDIETEFLRKRLDGLSTRVTLVFFFFVLLLGVFLALAYFYIERELENLKKEQAEILSPDHMLSQKLLQLSEMGNALSEEIKKQTEALEVARQELKKNSDALATRIKSLEQSGDLKQVKASLEKLEASEKALSAKLEANEKAFTAQLAETEKNFDAFTDIPGLVEAAKKENLETANRQKEIVTSLQAMQKKLKSLEDEIALFPIDSVQKEELDAAIRRQDTERTSLETRVNRKLQQMQILVDSLRGTPARSSGAPMPKQENLSE